MKAFAERLTGYVSIIRVGPDCDGWGKKPDIRLVAHGDEQYPRHVILKGAEGKDGTRAHLVEIARLLIEEGFEIVSWQRFDDEGNLIRTKRLRLDRIVRLSAEIGIKSDGFAS